MVAYGLPGGGGLRWAGFGEQTRGRRGDAQGWLLLGRGSGRERPGGAQSPLLHACHPPPDIQTPTHSHTEGCRGNRGLGQAPGAPSPPAAGSPPVALPIPIPGHPRTDPAVPTLRLRQTPGSDADVKAGVSPTV
jgi:hypothetical protein